MKQEHLFILMIFIEGLMHVIEQGNHLEVYKYRNHAKKFLLKTCSRSCSLF